LALENCSALGTAAGVSIHFKKKNTRHWTNSILKRKLIHMLKYFVSLFGLLLMFDSLAQDTASQFNNPLLLPNHPVYRNADNVFPLPKEAISALTIEGVGKTRTYILLDSTSSKFRLKNSDELKLTIKPGQIDAEANPFASYRLYSLVVNERKKHREYLAVTQKFGIGKSSVEHNPGLPIEIRSAENHTYFLLFPKLEPGEYALKIAGVIYSFGVD
jgi:hypothetical protein